MTYDYKTLTVLRNTEVDGIEASKLDDVPKFLQFIENQVEVPQHWVCWVTDIITF